jgi:hypothetical protein
MERYKLHWYTDSNGYRMTSNKYYHNNDDGFEGPFKGCFMVDDSLGKSGIVTIYGQVQLPFFKL